MDPRELSPSEDPRVSVKEVETHYAIIYVGDFNRETKLNTPKERLEAQCQQYCDEVGLCVWVTEGEYIYTDGNEHGYAVHLINYPRFPSTAEEVRGHARDLGKRLLFAMDQERLSIKTEEKTIMLSNDRRIDNFPQ
jgi:hypothetical protein